MPTHASSVPAREQSWVALLASTVGLQGLGRSKVRVFGQAHFGSEVRVVVQVFGADARPIGAAERVVSAGVLSTGLDVAVVYEGEQEALNVLAWVEPNSSELEFGALTATPANALALGTARASGDLTVLELVNRFGTVAA